MIKPSIAALAFGCLPFAALANDGYGGLSATGLTFGQTDAVAMEKEELYISPTKITVDYVFRNLTDQDVTGEVIFPLPPIGMADLFHSDFNLPLAPIPENLLGFRAVVDGKEVPVTTDYRAVLPPIWDENFTPRMAYDTPGEDITAKIEGYGLPLTLDSEELSNAILALSPEDQAKLEAEDLVYFESYEGENGPVALAYGNWAIVVRYHWTQTFPANQTLKVHHAYDNRPSGSVFGWEHPGSKDANDWRMHYIERYCIDDATSAGIVKKLKAAHPNDEYQMGSAVYIDYVLRTANSWAGPIGDFTLTLDKGAEDNIISLCMDGIKKTGPTTFVVHKTNFTPERDLTVLIVEP